MEIKLFCSVHGLLLKGEIEKNSAYIETCETCLEEAKGKPKSVDQNFGRKRMGVVDA